MTSMNFDLTLGNFGLFPVNLFIIGLNNDLFLSQHLFSAGESPADSDSYLDSFSVTDIGVSPLVPISSDNGSGVDSGRGGSHGLTRILTLVLSIPCW